MIIYFYENCQIFTSSKSVFFYLKSCNDSIIFTYMCFYIYISLFFCILFQVLFEDESKSHLHLDHIFALDEQIPKRILPKLVNNFLALLGTQQQTITKPTEQRSLISIELFLLNLTRLFCILFSFSFVFVLSVFQLFFSFVLQSYASDMKNREHLYDLERQLPEKRPVKRKVFDDEDDDEDYEEGHQKQNLFVRFNTGLLVLSITINTYFFFL